MLAEKSALPILVHATSLPSSITQREPAAIKRELCNLAIMPANGDRSFYFNSKADTITTVRWAGCRLGIGYR